MTTKTIEAPQAEAPAKPENPYARAYADFLENTEDHVLRVIAEDGVNRQVRMGEPGTGIWSWGITTWPGYLATFGDVADGYTFSRINDMFDFFDVRAGSRDYYSDSAPSIDFRYWAEKLSGGRSREVKEYSPKLFLQIVVDELEENDEIGLSAQEEYDNIVAATRQVCAFNHVDFEEYVSRGSARGDSRHVLLDIDEENDPEDLQSNYYGMEIPEQSPEERRKEVLDDARLASEDEHAAREWMQENQQFVGHDSYWESELRDWDVHFLFTCWAIDKTVQAYKAWLAERPAPGDDYVVVVGGLVQNEPSLPVFDLDVLDSDSPVGDVLDEIIDLHARIAAHRRARRGLADTLDRIEELVRVHGDAEQIAQLDAQRPKEG